MSTLKTLAKKHETTESAVYKRYFEAIFRDTNAQSSIRTRIQEATNTSKADFFSINYVPRSGRNKGRKTTLYYRGRKRDLLAWLSDISFRKGKSLVKKEKLGTLWEGFPLNNLTKEGGVRFPNGKKPEELIRRVIELASNQGELVLDSF